MFARIVGESFARNPRRKLLAAAALCLAMATATATLTVALEEGDRLAREFRSLGANLLVTPQADTLPLEIGGVDYRPVLEGAYLAEKDLGKLRTIFWRNNIVGFTPFLEFNVEIKPRRAAVRAVAGRVALIGTWYAHSVLVAGEAPFLTGVSKTHPWWKVEGAWFDDEATQCVIGRNLAERLKISRGDMIELVVGDRKLQTQVTGLLTTGGTEDNSVAVPLELAQRLADKPGEYRQLLVSALTKPEDELGRRDPATMSKADFDRWFCSPYISSIAHDIQNALPGVEARPILRIAESEGRILSRVSILFWLVTLASLLAAALAVAATAATTVLERRNEVGLMKALGATQGRVVWFFVAEQLLTAILGGAMGYVLGVILARELGKTVFGTVAMQRPLLLPLVILLAAVVVILGSLLPLRRAAKLRPAPVLRGE